MVCHARDIVNWLLDSVGLRYLTYGLFLTPIGVVIGSMIASRGPRSETSSENEKDDALGYFLTGFAVSLGAMLAGMCQARAIMLLAWMSPDALVALAGIIIGVFLWRK